MHLVSLRPHSSQMPVHISPSNLHSASTTLVNNWGAEHSCFVQIAHQRGISDEEITTRVLAVFPDLFPGGKSPEERKRAVEGRVAIWTSKWADQKTGEFLMRHDIRWWEPCSQNLLGMAHVCTT